MKGNKFSIFLLRALFIINLSLLIPILLRKPPIKDWLLIYLGDAVTNGIIDKILTSYKIIKYPVRLFPKRFDIHILFDFLIYPTFNIFYNQVTIKDKPLVAFYKLFWFTIPMLFIELWAVRKTSLVKWNKGWNWYHSFIATTVKSLVTRLFIGFARNIPEKQK